MSSNGFGPPLAFQVRGAIYPAKAGSYPSTTVTMHRQADMHELNPVSKTKRCLEYFQVLLTSAVVNGNKAERWEFWHNLRKCGFKAVLALSRDSSFPSPFSFRTHKLSLSWNGGSYATVLSVRGTSHLRGKCSGEAAATVKPSVSCSQRFKWGCVVPW